MALLNLFPDFAAKAALAAADLNTALAQILALIGGVDGDGNVYPGGLELDNFAASPAWRNDQKNERRSVFALNFFPQQEGLIAPGLGDLPHGFTIAAITATVASAGRTLTLSVTLKIDGVATATVAMPGPLASLDAPYSWATGIAVPAGAYLEAAFASTQEGNANVSDCSITLWCVADHVEDV